MVHRRTALHSHARKRENNVGLIVKTYGNIALELESALSFSVFCVH